VAYLSGLLHVFLSWIIAAYLPALLWLTTALVICGLSARLIMAYLSGSLLLTAGLLPLTGLIICGLLARLIVTHRALTELVPTRLIQSFLGLLSNFLTGLFCAYLRSQGTRSRLLILVGYLLGFLRKEQALPEYTLTCLDYCCLPAVLASLAYPFDFFSKPKARFSGKHSKSLKKSTSKAS
jgi:asparagine N-glycosylation enzyme membrane subunit Stt3